ncbi:NTP transferase domain-containing protein [Paenibacillus sp.]|uniref:NTP transferase domain-containing protein n=1 Tax=Paenibacillus sp. TaxID=58172 RepID=UPI00281112E6|nr:NTP transferase domain-containing protein [Paenibacillus sp.]
MKTYAIVLAAGKGTRMQSDLPKVLHRVGGKPMIEHLVDKLEQMNVDDIFVVVGYRGELVKAQLGGRVTYVEQREQLGTAHAVRQAAPLLKGKQGQTLVLLGDTPLLKPSTMERLMKLQRYTRCPGVVLTTLVDDPTGYGRIVRDPFTGHVASIVEDRDALPEQRRIREVNTGNFCFDNQSLFRALPGIRNRNAQQEYYLTDIVPALRRTGAANVRPALESLTLIDPAEAIGINTRAQLAEAEQALGGLMRAVV